MATYTLNVTAAGLALVQREPVSLFHRRVLSVTRGSVIVTGATVTLTVHRVATQSSGGGGGGGGPSKPVSLSGKRLDDKRRNDRVLDDLMSGRPIDDEEAVILLAMMAA